MIQLQQQTYSILNEKKQPRRARRDRGSHQVTERDEELLTFVAEQYAITLDQLAVLISRSHRTARGLRDRWCAAGWTHSAKLSVELPPFVWLTSRGTAIAGGRFRTWQPNHGLVRHIEAVTNVRLLLEQQLWLGCWECERTLAKNARSRSHYRDHLPDAILHGPTKTAIEVELTLKSRKRVEQIMLDAGIAYDRVWYFAPPRFLHRLRELAADMPHGNISVHRYPPTAADVAGAAYVEASSTAQQTCG